MAWSNKQRAVALGAGIGCALAAWKMSKGADLRRRNRSIRPNQKIVILGAGFAGVSVARELSRLLPSENEGQITLVDQNNYLLFTPMLTEVAGGELDPRHILASPRRLSRRIKFERGRVHDIDFGNKALVLDAGNDGAGRRTLKWNQLVIALGSVANYHGIPGVEEHSLGLKSIGDAAAIRNRILESLEQAGWEQDPNVRRALLTFVVGGGGYTGVETMAAINDLARASLRDYPRVDSRELRTVIIEPGDRILAELSSDLASFAQEVLERHGVEIRLKTKISGANENWIDLENGERIRSRTLIWAGGITPSPFIETIGLPRGKHGGLVVDECCAIPSHPGVWALGDCAEIPKTGSEGTYAPTAQNATREGWHVARNIAAVLRGDAAQPFSFEPIGELALVGRHAGVARLYGHCFAGLFAWAMWRAVYIAKMPGIARRARIVADWALDFTFGRNITEFPQNRSHCRPQ